jgi:ubiquitin-conjugating enzyme E2 O
MSHYLEEDNASQVRAGPLSVPLAAIGYVTRLATGLFSRHKKHPISESEDGPEASEITSSEDSEKEDSVVEGDVRNNVAVVVDPSHSATDIGDDDQGFKHFDIMQSPPDHHFLDSNGRVRPDFFLITMIWLCGCLTWLWLYASLWVYCTLELT